MNILTTNKLIIPIQIIEFPIHEIASLSTQYIPVQDSIENLIPVLSSCVNAVYRYIKLFYEPWSLKLTGDEFFFWEGGQSI